MVNVIFLHPDLGIGGAERAVIDAALALKSKGHNVHFVTAHHDPSHCFQETKDGTVPVTTAGDWLPRSICGRFYALCAYIRMIYAAIYLVFFSSFKYELVFCDQVSACIPILRMSDAKILFYCHFPDMLLTKREGFLKKLYRKPIDWLEEKTTGMAHSILVNSRFTDAATAARVMGIAVLDIRPAEVFKTTFTSLSSTTPKVLYPIPDFSAFDKPVDPAEDQLIPKQKEVIFLSINRYERKKNLGLAIEALGQLKQKVPDLGGIHLIMAGGYDERVVENKEHYLELRHLCEKNGLGDFVTFLRSFTDSQKRTLLHHSTCLLYTPDKEHFGIVPIEAMYMRRPVIAVASGGPLETVEHEVTGYLCEPTPESFSKAMENFVNDKKLSQQLGDAGRHRVESRFSFKAFTEQLDRIVKSLLQDQ